MHVLYFEPKYEEFGRVRSGASRVPSPSAFKEQDAIPQFKAPGKPGELREGRFAPWAEPFLINLLTSVASHNWLIVSIAISGRNARYRYPTLSCCKIAKMPVDFTARPVQAGTGSFGSLRYTASMLSLGPRS